mmetsp:Transcript_4465/g.6635  ORF Transcript_4465/g.6635 Transcript_4465/m.6635 type:complete len:123 (+) Transcript_4465:3333-3701(+)
MRQVILYNYYSITTLSTVGLGDFHPISNYERMAAMVMLMAGVAIFSSIMTVLIDVLGKYLKLDQDYDDSKELEKFFHLLRKFNDNQMINLDIRKEITAFLEHRWSNDRNNCIQSEYEQYLLD